MNCPNCGMKLPEGKMYCEACGAEIQIVPDYDLDIESEMKKTLSDIADKEFAYDDMDFDDDPTILSLLFSKKRNSTPVYIALGIVIVIIIVFSVILGKKLSKQSSFEYQIEMANEMLSQNNILKAIDYLEDAYKIKADSSVLFDIADYYFTLGRENDAIFALMRVVDDDFPSVEKESAYKKIISLYQDSKNYEAIALLLNNCTISSILNDYADYCVFAPSFNVEGGTYNESITLSIKSEGNGSIYYSYNDTEPSEETDRYTAPLFLEYGTYVVNAIYVNPFGVSSEKITQKYLIDAKFEFEPEILTESGNYTEATLIEAEVPIMYTLYYTTDGTDPTKDSKRYINPIAMPEGNSTFKFVMYASDGTMSSIVEKNYNLTYSYTYTPSEGVQAVGNYLMNHGLLSPDGWHRDGVDGKILLMYSAIYPIEGYGTFYFVIEYVEDDNGVQTLTGNNYAVNVNDLGVYRVNSSEEGYILSGI